MRGKSRRIAASAVLAAAACLALTAAPSQAATTIGSSLLDSPSSTPTGTCGFTAAEAEHSCTASQANLEPGHIAPAGLVAPTGGVIVRWRVRSGTPTAATASVKLQLRVLHENTGGIGEATFTTLPLGEPGVHVFPTRLPIAGGDRIGVDARIGSPGGTEAELPIVYQESGVGGLDRWTPSLAEGVTESQNGFPTSSEELLLNADIEPDADHDGYGDETQDLCPTDPLVHAACPTTTTPGPTATGDTQPPRTKLTYPVRQNFLVTKKVLIHFRSNEAATAFASGQLEIPSRHTIFGLHAIKAQVGAGKRATLRLRLAKNTVKAARRAYANGRKIVIKVTAFATDAAGNKSGASVATIKPQPPRR
jgi:hypothetical protein